MKLKWIYIIVVLAAFFAYANTLSHGFVWDDQIVITLNNVTNQGLDGLKEIWTTQNYIQDRPTYRPVPQSYFAILWEFFPDNPFPFHIGTVLLYVLSCFSFLFVLKQFFPILNNWLLLFIGMYFTLLPVHSEVVANSKSSDEILSAIFVLWSFYFAKKQRFKFHLIAVFLFVLALLSKISAITVLPILLFVLAYKNESFKNNAIIFKNQLYKFEKVLTVFAFFSMIALTTFASTLYSIFAVPLIFILAWYALNELKQYYATLVLAVLFALLYFSGTNYLGTILFFYVLASQSKASLNRKNISVLLTILVGALFVILSKKFLILFVILSLYAFWEFNKKEKITIKVALIAIGIPILLSIAALLLDRENVKIAMLALLSLLICLIIIKQYASKYMFPFILLVALAFDFESNKFNHQGDFTHLFKPNQTTQIQDDKDLVSTNSNKRIFTNEPYHNILVAAPNAAVKTATILRIQLIYLQKLVFPIHLVHQHGTWQINFATWKSWDIYLSILIHLALLYMLFTFYKRKKWMLFWSLLWFFMSISIYTNIVRLMPDTLAERFLFLPSIGFSVFFILSVHSFLTLLITDQKAQKFILAFIFIPLFSYYAFRVVSRNNAWESNYTLSAQTLPYAQNNAAINAQYAVELRNLVKYNLVENKDSANAVAIKHYNTSIDIFPGFYGPYSDLAIYYILEAEPDKAFPYLVKATELKPDEWIHQYYLGLIYYERKKYNDAISNFEAIIGNKKINEKPTENPELKDAYEYAARCYYNLGKVNEAAEKLEEAINRFNNSSSFVLLANIYRKSGKQNEAIQVYKKLLIQEPDNQELRNTINYLEQGLIY